MREEVLNYILNQETMSVESLALNILVAFALGLLIFVSYRLAYSGISYSRKFSTSLVMMTLVTTIVMTIISGNLALSLGMVGALSIVRFRTAVKDPRDTTYIFWTIAVGVACGVGQYLAAAVGSAAVFVYMLIAGKVRFDGKNLLIIKSGRNAEKEIESIVYLYFQKVNLRAKNTMRDDVEFIYELTERAIRKAKKNNAESITDKLYELEAVRMVNLITQNDDINR